MAGELGDLLKRMIGILKAHRGKSMSNTLAYLENKLGYTPDTIRKWMQGKHKPDSTTLTQLVEIGVAEAGMDRQWAERMLYQGKHPDRETLLRRLFPTPEVPTVRHNLPRRTYIRLIGRDDELTEILRRLNPEEHHWLVPIEGIGGIGKSALALEIGWHFVQAFEQLPAGRRFNAIVWASAKRQTLTVQGIESIPQSRQTLTNMDDIYRAIADVLEWPAILVPREEQPREVEKALRQTGRTLIILDNLETVDDAQALAFLRELPQPAKAVATMRFHEDMPYPIRLKELDREASRELISQECAGRGVVLDDEEIDQLLKYTRGLPLAIWWAIGLMGMEGYGVKATLQRLRDPQDELLHFIFAEAISTLRSKLPNAYHALLALTFFDLDTGASLSALGAALGLDDDTTQVALHRLLSMNLVNRAEGKGRYTILPLTMTYAQAEVNTIPAWEKEARKRWVRWYDSFITNSISTGLPMDRWNPVERVSPLLASSVKPGVEMELRNILILLQWLQTESHHKELARVYRVLAPFLFAEGFWESTLNFGELIAKEALKTNNKELFVWCTNMFSRIYTAQGKHEVVKFWLEKARTVVGSGKSKETKRLSAVIIFAEGGLLSDQEHYDKAEYSFRRALDISREVNDPFMAARCLNRIGNTFLRRNRFAEAKQFYQESLTLWQTIDEASPDVIDGVSVAKGNLGIVASREGRYEDARDILYGIEPQLTWQSDFAELYIELAVVEYHLGNLEKAQGLAQRAETIMARLELIRPHSGGDKEWLQLKEAGKV